MNKTAKNTLIGVSLAGLLFLALKSMGKNQSDTSYTDESFPDTTSTKTGTTSKAPTKASVPLWKQWASKYKGPEVWYKEAFDNGIKEEIIANVMVVLRSKKDLGYNRTNLVAKYDDASRTVYLKWAVRTFQSKGVSITQLPVLYKKAFNQDLKVQYQSIYSKVVPLIDPVKSSDIWNTKPVAGFIGLI